jgi:Ca2+-binding RTX toxin-like protein
MRGQRVATGVCVCAAALIAAPAAIGSTISSSGSGAITYRGDAVTASNLTVSSSASPGPALTVTFTDSGSPIADPLPPTCSRGAAATVNCLNPSGDLEVTFGAGSDSFDIGGSGYGAGLVAPTIRVAAGPGNDVVDLRAAALRESEVHGAKGNDRLIGTEVQDSFFGGAGGDDLFGLGGNDLLYGQGGVDVLRGGSARDFCDGGGGEDRGSACEKKRRF